MEDTIKDILPWVSVTVFAIALLTVLILSKRSDG